MALMMGVAVGFVSNNFSSQVRKQSSHLIAVIRFAYNQASISGKAYRLVFDIPEQTYWLEEGPESVIVKTTEDESAKESDQNSLADAPDENTPNNDDDETLKAVSDFTEVDNDTVKKIKLGDSVFIRDIFVAHQKEIIEDEVAYLYFFPSGMTEFAVIHLSDEKQERNYSLIVNPVTGGVKVEPEYVEHESLLQK